MTICCLTCIATFVSAVDMTIHKTAAELHATNRITAEWVHSCVLSLNIAEVLVEIQVFTCKHSLATHIVRVHAFPTAWQGTSVEDDHQSEVVCIAKDLFIEAHCLLFVATEEIHLDSLHANLLHPLHILLACNRVAHHIDRTLCNVVPPSARTVPKEYFYSLRTGITHKVSSAFNAHIHIPTGIYKGIRITHCLCQIYIFTQVRSTDSIILPYYPRPCTLSIFIIMCRFETRFYEIPCNSGFDDRFQTVSNGNGAPWSSTRQGKCRFWSAVAVILFCHRKLHSIESVSLHI